MGGWVVGCGVVVGVENNQGWRGGPPGLRLLSPTARHPPAHASTMKLGGVPAQMLVLVWKGEIVFSAGHWAAQVASGSSVMVPCWSMSG